ncbi:MULTISPECIES: hypothetical protein [Achromobacter]|uniref:Uncharacterized protein n=1 Tax=Achromobacter denitrificans TaxID=32002 RepID=A0ABZ3FWP2_ACHDE|nr:hypothetical protein [Achromobacter piechaudii]CAB3924186.1 hypothetical protein LMG2828_05852 [Achromobacter piechaudii]
MVIEKGSNGRWFVDGEPVVVQTTRYPDGLMYQSANIPDEDVEALMKMHTFVGVQNQHGERVELSFDMDGWSLLVEDEGEQRSDGGSRIETEDRIGGTYREDVPGGMFGDRLNRDRRYWLAWATVSRETQGDCLPGIMDDFGSLVPVPSPRRQAQL